MKKLFTAAIITLVGFSANAQTKTTTVKKTMATAKPAAAAKKPIGTAKPTTSTPVFKNILNSASYALGLNIASSFKSGGLNAINYELFNRGIKDVFAGSDPTLSQEKAQATIAKLFEGFSKQREEAEKLKYASTINAGTAFLTQNKAKAGIKTTASGLQYEVLTQGEGKTPLTSDMVTVNYKGTLLNGTPFDSSYDRGEPATFALNRVIPGWTEALQLMKEGSKYRFFVPYNLGYGSRATPDGSIPPFSTLIFEIELIKVGETAVEEN